MAFPTTSVLDNFSGGAQDPLAGNWAGPIRVGREQWARTAGGEAAPNAGVSGTKQSYWSASTFGPDSEVFCTITALWTTSGDYLDLFTRINTPNTAGIDAYSAEIEFKGASMPVQRFYKWVDDVVTQIGSDFTMGALVATGDKFGFTCTGSSPSTLRAWYNNGGGWTQLGSDLTDSAGPTAAGYIGMETQRTSGPLRVDDFGGGTVVPSADGGQNLLLLGAG